MGRAVDRLEVKRASLLAERRSLDLGDPKQAARYDELYTAIGAVTSELKELRRGGRFAKPDKVFSAQVSDHALVRYMERHHGIDVQRMKDEMLTPEVRMSLRLGASRVYIDGVEYRARNGVVITVI